MQYGQDDYPPGFHLIDHQEWCASNDEFTSLGHTPYPTQHWVYRELSHSILYLFDQPLGGGWFVVSDVSIGIIQIQKCAT